MGAASAPDTAESGNGNGNGGANPGEGQAKPSEPKPNEPKPNEPKPNEPKPNEPSANEAPKDAKTEPQAAPPSGASSSSGATGAAGATGGSASSRTADLGPIPTCHYKALNLKSDATDEDIKKAFKQLSMILHPDKNPSTDAKARFQRINEAKSFLLDRDRRCGYDAQLYTEKLLNKIGVAMNQQVVEWVKCCLLIASDAKVEEVFVDRQLTNVIPHHFNELMQQSGGARFFSMHSPSQGVVLIGGIPALIRKGKEVLSRYLKELCGKQAPADGLVFIAPSDRIGQLGNINYQTLIWQHGSQVHRAANDRVVIRGGHWAAIVAYLQGMVDFRGRTLNSSGQELDCWRFAHMCELSKLAVSQMLPLHREPDATAVRKLFQYALQLDENSKLSLTEMALRILKSKPSTVCVRAASSAAVHDEYSKLTAKQGAPLVCAFAALQMSVSGVRVAIQQRFAVDTHVQTLQKLDSFMQSDHGVVERSKGYIAAKDSVPDDSKWHKWEDVLQPDNKIAAFWKELRETLRDVHHRNLNIPAPPLEWNTVPEVMSMVLKRCAGPHLQMDPEKGILHLKEQAPPAPAPAGQPTGGKATTGTSPVKGAASTASTVPGEEMSLTLVEHAEDVVHELSEKKDDLELGMVTQQVQRRTGEASSTFSKRWYIGYKLSFEVRMDQENTSKFHIKLTPASRKRAEVRALEKMRRHQTQAELRVAKDWMSKVRENGTLPTTLNAMEMCCALIILGGEETFAPGLPSNILKQLCRHNTKFNELLKNIQPFNTAMLMRAIVNLHQKQAFRGAEDNALVAIMQAASLEMHDTEGVRKWAPLTVVRDCALAACKKPFVSLFETRTETTEKVLPASAALRIQLELTMEQNLCPPCLSPDYGNFRVFAELCAALANLYGMVWQSLSKEHAENVEQAFEKLAKSCQIFYESLNSKDSRGLCRLAFAFALIGQHKSEKLKTICFLGLSQMCKVIRKSLNHCDESGWDLDRLADIAWSFKSYSDDQLFKAMGEAVVKLADGKLRREAAVKVMTGFHQLNAMKHLEQFCKRLKQLAWFKRTLVEVGEKDLPFLLSAMILGEDFDAVEELEKWMKKDRRQEVSLNPWMAMLKESNDCNNAKAKNLNIVLREKIAVAVERSRSALSASEIEGVLKLCPDSRAWNKVVELLSQRKKLDSIPKANTGRAWSDFNSSLEREMGLLRSAKCRAPRLEAAVAGRMMQGLESCVFAPGAAKPLDADLVKSILTAGLLLSEEALVSMPALVHGLVEALSKGVPLPKETEQLRRLMKNMLSVGGQASSDKDETLERWTSQVEEAIIKEAGTRLEIKRDIAEMAFAGGEESRIKNEAKEALGGNWLPIILARSRRLSWLGLIHIHPPRPCTALRSFAEGPAANLLTPELKDQARALVAEAPVARAIPERGDRSRSRERATTTAPGGPVAPEGRAKAKAKAGVVSKGVVLKVSGCTDERIGKCLEGGYCRDGVHHQKARFRRVVEPHDHSVEAVWLYYWDAGHGEEDQGWWFSADIGGPDAWLHNPKAGHGNQPPLLGWDLGIKITLSAVAGRKGSVLVAGKAKGNGKAGAGAAAKAATPAKRPREDVPDERHVQLEQWLKGLDNGGGSMMKYFDALKSEFDGDLTQIAAARIENNPKASPIEQVEPSFWSAINCSKGLDKSRFAKGIIALAI